MNTLKQILLIIVLLVVAFLLYTFGKAINSPEEAPIEETPIQEETTGIDMEGWITYANDTYGFSIMHPTDWKVTVTETYEPMINIYPKDTVGELPFTHHSSVTQVSIFPHGVPTEGVIGDVTNSTVEFTEPANRAIDYVLSSGERWATYVTFANPGTEWEEWGFIWAEAPAKNLTMKCIVDGERELPLNDCPLFESPDGGPSSVQVVREGSVDTETLKIEEAMLKSFKFNR